MTGVPLPRTPAGGPTSGVPARGTPPAQTITVSADRLGEEMAARLTRALAGFVVYRSGFAVVMVHEPCRLRWIYPRSALMDLVLDAMAHDCPRGPQ